MQDPFELMKPALLAFFNSTVIALNDGPLVPELPLDSYKVSSRANEHEILLEAKHSNTTATVVAKWHRGWDVARVFLNDQPLCTVAEHWHDETVKRVVEAILGALRSKS